MAHLACDRAGARRSRCVWREWWRADHFPHHSFLRGAGTGRRGGRSRGRCGAPCGQPRQGAWSPDRC